MSKYMDLTKLGGLFTFQNTLNYLQSAYREPMGALAQFIGNQHVVSGCVDNGVTCSDGFITYGGEIIPFTGGALSPSIVITTTVTPKAFKDGTLKDVLYTKTASFGIGVEGFDYADLKRIPFGLTSITSFSENIARMVKAITQFEDEVILEGCIVSDVVEIGTTLAISAGFVLFNGKLLQSPSYTGTYPAYLKEDGGWVTVEPVAGLFIKFDPYTSQRYINVLDRALTPAGRIVMMETLTDRFDAGFVGRWEMKGYSLMSTLQSRVPVGLWYDGIAVADVTDVNHNTAENQGGKKAETLTPGQLPQLTNPNHNLVNKNGVNTFTAGDASAGEFDNQTSVDWPGNGDAVNIQQPYTIVVYAKRTA